MPSTISPEKPKTAPQVMDVSRPSKSVAPDHQLAEHGTPGEPATTAPDVSPDDLLAKVSMEHATTSAGRPSTPIGLIVATVVVVIILIILSWFALSVTPS